MLYGYRVGVLLRKYHMIFIYSLKGAVQAKKVIEIQTKGNATRLSETIK